MSNEAKPNRPTGLAVQTKRRLSKKGKDLLASQPTEEDKEPLSARALDLLRACMQNPPESLSEPTSAKLDDTARSSPVKLRSLPSSPEIRSRSLGSPERAAAGASPAKKEEAAAVAVAVPVADTQSGESESEAAPAETTDVLDSPVLEGHVSHTIDSTYGFVVHAGNQLFFHLSSLVGCTDVKRGQPVSFKAVKDPWNPAKSKAFEVTPIAGPLVKVDQGRQSRGKKKPGQSAGKGGDGNRSGQGRGGGGAKQKGGDGKGGGGKGGDGKGKGGGGKGGAKAGNARKNAPAGDWAKKGPSKSPPVPVPKPVPKPAAAPATRTTPKPTLQPPAPRQNTRNKQPENIQTWIDNSDDEADVQTTKSAEWLTPKSNSWADDY
jgi:hypothetical protein